MKRFALVGLVLPLLGCPYDSKVPLGPSSEGRIDPALLGAWSCKGEGSDRMTLGVVAFDDTQYVLDLHDKDGGGPFRAWSTQVAGATVLNVQELDKPLAQRGFTFVRYTIDKETLLLRVAEDKLLKDLPENAAALREALVNDRPGLFDEFCRCERAVNDKK